jgi:hypothetical protein
MICLRFAGRAQFFRKAVNMAKPSSGKSSRSGSGAEVSPTVGKRIVFDLASWQTLDLLARDRMMTFQELADEAFLDIPRKYDRPYDTRDALKRSARLAQANDNKGKNGGPKSKRPAKGRARS